MNLINAQSWAEEMDVRVTVCDLEGKIVYMNKASSESMHNHGGDSLIGKSIFDCHNSISCQIIREMLQHPFVNTYIVEKDSKRRLIRQFPWEENGIHNGIIEFSFSVPSEITVKVKD